VTDANASLDRLARSMNAVAYRRPGATPWTIDQVWGDSEQILGCPASALIGPASRHVVHVEDQPRVERAYSTLQGPHDRADLVVRVQRPSGETVPVSAHAWGVFDADGSLRAVEGYVVPLEASGAHGRLMQGFLHDLNNVLCAVLWSTMRAADLAGGNHALSEVLEGTRKAASTAADLAYQMARLGAPDGSGEARIDEVLRSMLPLLPCLVGLEVELVARLRAGDARVALAPVELERIVLNLTTNAKEAVGLRGRVNIETSKVLQQGTWWVRLVVRDTGPGVAPEALPVLLESGVSSKRAGRGLGLAIVRELVTVAGGHVELMREPEGGATFAVVLPLVE
jgi:signal transduction histidine kinase